MIICILVLYRSIQDKAADNFQPNLTMYYHNINSTNNSLPNLADTIIKSKVDVIGLVEVSPEINLFLTNQLSNYHHNFSLPRNDNFGFSIFSKDKITILQVFMEDGYPIFIKFHIGNNNINIYLMHLPPPLWRGAIKAQKETLALITDDINKNKTVPYLIIGDLNMSPESALFQDFYKKIHPPYYTNNILTQGTWPSFMPFFLRLQLDHVLSNKRFKKEVGVSAGSDHQSLLIKLN